MASAKRLAADTKSAPSKGIASSASRISDLVRNFPECVLLGLCERGFGAFAIDFYKMNFVFFRKVEINHARPAALANSRARKCHACFSEASATAKDRPLCGFPREVVLECAVVFIWKTGDLFCEIRRFDKLYMTMSHICQIADSAGLVTKNSKPRRAHPFFRVPARGRCRCRSRRSGHARLGDGFCIRHRTVGEVRAGGVGWGHFGLSSYLPKNFRMVFIRIRVF